MKKQISFSKTYLYLVVFIVAALAISYGLVKVIEGFELHVQGSGDALEKEGLNIN